MRLASAVKCGSCFALLVPSALRVPAAPALDASLLQREHVAAVGAFGVVAARDDERGADLVVGREVFLRLGVGLDLGGGSRRLGPRGAHAVEAGLDALVELAGDLALE